MPGRDDLVQQNIARARAQAEAPRPQEKAGQSALSSGVAPRSFFGGNYDVYSQLESIQFQGALGDASMRGNVAYIRIWKRGGVAGQAGTIPTSQINPGVDYSQQLGNEINRTLGEIGLNREELQEIGGTIEYSSTDNYAIITSPDFEQNEDGEIIRGERTTVFVPGDTTQRQRDLATQTPITTTGSNSASINVSAGSSAQTGSTTASSQTLGTVRSANPNGFINALGRVGRALVGIPQGPPLYSGQANAPRVDVSSAVLGEMMWQFLFNPSELELDVGPEFKSAETWGVSDKANSGQPLHWSHNKNAQLKFNSILLNGFVFGRKVEVLEQGLIELFMARDGAGQHGPHVLEFVWGKRTFGPCVIKNINIKEKMWDEGEVVNAELSFTLEQVPEWTINDGAYVDVARPGRRPLQEEASAAASGQQQQQQTPATQQSTPGGGASPAQKPATIQQPEDFVGCKNLQQLGINAKAFNPSPGTYAIIGGRITSETGSNKGRYQSRFSTNYLSYNSFVAKGNNLGVTTEDKCLPSKIKGEHDRLTKNSSDSLKEIADKQMVSLMKQCASSLGNKASTFYSQKGCKRFQSNPNSTTERI